MAYISLQSLKRFLGIPGEEAFFTDKDSVYRTIESQYAANNIFTEGKKSFSQVELVQMVSQLKDEVIIVFDQWINSSPGLSKLLLEETLTRNDFGDKLDQHLLFPAFKRFITPFLVPELKRFLDQNTGKHQFNAASYLPLMDEQGQFIIQDQLLRQFSSDWQLLQNELETVSSEADFNEKIKRFYLPEHIGLFNFFTKPFYAHKVKFVENSIELFRHPMATAPVVLWITKQLQNLELNPEHKEKVSMVHRSVLQGDQSYFTAKPRVQANWSFKKTAGILAVLALVGFSIFYLVNYAGKVSPQDDEKTASSFSKFTPEERMQLDSLIRTMEQKTVENEDFTDRQNTNYLHLTPVQAQINSRDPLRNKLAEQYVQDCMKAYDLSEMSLIDSCAVYPENKIKKLEISPFTALSAMPGDVPLLLRNESDYQVQILIFEEKANGEVYSIFVPAQDAIKCKVREGYRMVLVPGNNLGKAELPKLSGVSKFYKHHFCFMDGNFLAQLFQVYVIKDIPQSEIKILLNSTANQQLYVVDLYEALEIEN
ncbi:MAG: hypothetical protein K0R65_2512 [Crocinitomicaceae bacterium]|jgi:hypothetical protein|nr:hypothetical protein [Crocinitomicaceae bacterium]